MRKGWLSRLGAAAFLGLLTVGTGAANTGCAKEAEPISQVQNGAIRKSDLVGTDPKNPTEWYMRSTVVDVRRTNPFAFPGFQDELRRVRWEIQENFLIARKAYELVAGSDGKGADPFKNDGVIVAMYRIEGHFDVRRAYNPNTGEEMNVLTENRIDRPWFDRDFIRVDWSRNLVTDPEFGLWYGELFGDIQWQPVSYWENDPLSPNAPVRDMANGYFDHTSKWFAKTETLWGWLPMCWLQNLYSGSDVYECNDQEIAVRQSFMKVGNRDYEPAETNSEKMSMFGTFNRDRYGFDKQYEIHDKHWHRLMARHNVWAKTHNDNTCFADGNKATADATCNEKVAGSTCDLYSAKCTIPLKDRPIRTIAYHVSKSMPTDLWGENVELIREWDEAMRDAVAASREVECRRLGGDKASCHDQFFDDQQHAKDAKHVLTLCHNPVVAEDDQEACGKVGTSAREGDLRYNLIGWVDMPLAAAPLGYGPDGADPVTGEVVQATSYIYGASLDSYAGMARDLVSVMLGDLKPDQFVNGDHVAENLGAYDPTKSKDAALWARYSEYLQGKVKPAGLTAADIESRLKGLEPKEFIARINATKAVEGKGSPAERLSAINDAIATKGLNGDVGFGGKAEYEARLKSLSARLSGSRTEQALLEQNKSYFASTNLDPSSAAKLEKAMSPFSSTGLQMMEQFNEKLRVSLEQKGICMMGLGEFNAPHFEGLAKRIAAKYADITDVAERRLKVFQDLRRAIYRGVTEHEIGHTVALRHNFQGSWDSMNFHPNYWKLRTGGDWSKAKECTGPRTATSPDTCMGPRYLDPESAEEVGVGGKPHAGIEEFSYSSIMDYGFDFNSDLSGIGSYDRAAMKFIYGQVVETFPAGDALAPNLAPIHADPTSEVWMVKRNDAKMGGGMMVQPTHYTTLARLLEKRIYDPARCRDATEAEMTQAIDGKICLPMVKDHAHISEMVSGKLDGIDANVWAPAWKSKDGRIRWPYRFGTDEFASYPHNLRFDAGADIYEAAASVSSLYEYRYPLEFFRRGRRGWMPWFSMLQRQWGRYFSRFHTLAWQATARLGTYAAMYPDKPVTENNAAKSADWGEGYALALPLLFETIEKAALRPQPGGYTAKADPLPGFESKEYLWVDDLRDAPKSAPAIGALDGRWIDDDMDNVKGGSFNYQSYLTRMGTHVEKPLAAVALMAQFPPVHTYSRDSYRDGRNMLLNFRTLMPTATDRLLAIIMSGDVDAGSPYIDRAKKDPFGNVEVSYPKLWEQSYTMPANLVPVDPLIGYRLQVPTIIYSLYFGTQDADMGAIQKMRVWVEGGIEGFALPDNEKAFFYEPESGLTWAARKHGTETVNGITRPTGIGERMLLKANYLLAFAYKVQKDANGLPIYDETTHRPKWEVGAKEGEITSAANLNIFRRHVGLLNVTRQLMQEMGLGPLN